MHEIKFTTAKEDNKFICHQIRRNIHELNYDTPLIEDLRACHTTEETEAILLYWYKWTKRMNRKIKWNMFWRNLRYVFSKFNSNVLEERIEQLEADNALLSDFINKKDAKTNS